MDETRLKIIGENPIGNGLDSFRALFASACESQGLVSSNDAIDVLLDQETLQSLTLNLLAASQVIKTARLLRSAGRGKHLLDDISRLVSTIYSDDFDFDRFKPLFRAVLDENPNDVFIWIRLYDVARETTSLRQPTYSSVENTPITRNTSSILNSSGLRREVDKVLRKELDPRVGIAKFRESFFASVPNLEAASDTVFRKCCEGDEPLFGQGGWAGWPADAGEQAVLAWLSSIIPKLESLAAEFTPSTLTQRRKLLAQPKTPLIGSTGKRSMDVGFVNNDLVHQPLGKSRRYRWSHVLVPGELKSNPKADSPPLAWIDLAAYAREVLSAQDNRRFVLAFSLCGSMMRLWEYDRIGGIASEQFSINESKGGLELVATMLGFLWIDEERLGFDPTIMTSDGKRFIEIERNGQPERLIIDEVITRARCVAGRATTCWKAHREDDPQTALVIKDSWQYPERDEEGEIIQEATERGAVNVSRYYHHETVRIRGFDDDTRSCVRNGLDVGAPALDTADTVDTAAADDTLVTEDTSATTVMARRASTTAIIDTTDAVDAAATVDSTATTVIARRASITTCTSTASTIAAAANNRRRRSTAQRGKRTPRVQQLRQSESKSSRSNNSSGNSGNSKSSGSSDSIGSGGGSGTKRPFSQVNEADAQPAKRRRSGSDNANASAVDKAPPNRVHRRIIVQDYGQPIYKANSPKALVAALESCIRGHQSLRQAGFLHRDISVNNVLIDEDGPPSRKGFLIDLDLAIRESRREASGAKGKTGTRAFMAIGLLFGEPHCFMHDLESFFWVLFWVCVNYNGPHICVRKNSFDHWNYSMDYELAGSKLGVITDSGIFRKRAKESFTPFYEPLIPLMDKLREAVFPGGQRWRRADDGLYCAMREILGDEEN